MFELALVLGKFHPCLKAHSSAACTGCRPRADLHPWGSQGRFIFVVTANEPLHCLCHSRTRRLVCKVQTIKRLLFNKTQKAFGDGLCFSWQNTAPVPGCELTQGHGRNGARRLVSARRRQRFHAMQCRHMWFCLWPALFHEWDRL